jgi:uncharacterized protein
VRQKDGPFRQCISCKGRFHKGELLRFVLHKEEAGSFDERQRRVGRGYYVCPEQSCFLNAWKNRRSKALFRDKSTTERLLDSVCDALLRSAENGNGLPMLRNLRFYERLSSKGRAL